MAAQGKKCWAIPGGHVPWRSTGHEPECTSRDELCILNTGDEGAEIGMTIYYADRDPVGPYPLTVKGKRVRNVRFNDLIDPEAMPLDTDFACVLESNVPVIVQFTRRDTGQPENAIASLMAYPIGD